MVTGLIQVRDQGARPRFGLLVGHEVQIAFGVRRYGGQRGIVYGFSGNKVAVTVGGSMSDPEAVTFFFVHTVVLRFGFFFGQDVQIDLDVPGHGGQEGIVRGFGDNKVAVTIDGFSSGPKTRTVCFDSGAVLSKAA